MFSRSNHHRQEGLTVPPPQEPTFDFSLRAHDDLLSHHRHLESLLDSALATLVLICDFETAASTALPYSPHLLAVIRHLASRIFPMSPLLTATSGSAATAAPDETLPTAQAAAAATSHDTNPATQIPAPAAPDTAATSHDINTATQIPAPVGPETNNITTPQVEVVAAVTPMQRGGHGRLNIRCSRVLSELPTSALPDAPSLYVAVIRALMPLAEKNTPQRALLAGAGWTKNRNIVLHAAGGNYTVKFLHKHRDAIWSRLRPLLELTDDSLCPPCDAGNTWHSVVFHDVPVPPNRRTVAWFNGSRSTILGWAKPRSSEGIVHEFSVMCQPEEIPKRNTVSLRLYLSSKADAESLVRDGGFMFGAPCRVSHYVPKSRSPSPSPQV
ncbi:hypothetical protein MSAN_01727800 [Mycena sanguinolenta]|uniref:Uncharacterized protein n=1 Tax=Mycena sanguinolenta TaxID=230812 RepID=A0A8H6XW89_9AGAR|nr:hypothetical protein MSAN_01727800 [Mycena sanguinolenta]